MEIKTVWIAECRRHKGTLTGIFILILILSLSLICVLTIWKNSEKYVQDEMERLGFGEITAWVSGISDIEKLTDEIKALSVTDKIGVQPVIFSEYEVNGQKSDSEGQLVTYEPEVYPYKIFYDDLHNYQTEKMEIKQGEIYVSPSMQSMFGVELGDKICFPAARNGVEKSFTVKGWFEDPFMGSTMIGMKSFLICRQDHDEIVQILKEAGIDSLAREGYMLHIFQNTSKALNTAKFHAALNNDTQLLQFTEFTHSDNAIFGFMLTLQNVFTGFMLAFVVVLILVLLVVLEHSIGSSIEQEMKEIGILKTLGFTTKKLQKVQILLYIVPILCGMCLGISGAFPIVSVCSRITLTTTGLLIPTSIPFEICLPALLLVLFLLAGFIYLKTAHIEKITPMKAIRREKEERKGNLSPIHQKKMVFWLALRQISTGKKRYIGAYFIAILLVFFTSLIGRIDSWLGPNGEGLMDAFHPSDLHIAAQPVGKVTSEDVERVISAYSGITDKYMLAMPSVSVNGTDYTANVITEPVRFHMLNGKTCTKEDEIVLTEFVASDLDVEIGDMVVVSTGTSSEKYKVSGIYQCANDMGANVGLSREGYLRIGKETANMWCIHYFLEDINMQDTIIGALEETYKKDVYLHENSWFGLYGILSAMKFLMYFMYGVESILILVITVLTGSKLLAAEQQDMGIYKSLGFSSVKLRISFTLRFGIISFFGAAVGIFLSSLLTDPLTGALFKMFGISNFTSYPTAENILLPAMVVIGCFISFAWVAAGKIRKFTVNLLIIYQ